MGTFLYNMAVEKGDQITMTGIFILRTPTTLHV
jgi:hypothetical protein